MKRFISIVVAIILVLQVVAVSTFAAPLNDGKFKPAIDMKKVEISEGKIDFPTNVLYPGMSVAGFHFIYVIFY